MNNAQNKSIYVMETTIEGAQKRIAAVIDRYAAYDEGGISPDLEYIAVFLDSVDDELAAITSSYNSLHARYVEALAAIDEWKDNFEAVSMASARRLEEKFELQKQIHRLREENEAITTLSKVDFTACPKC